MKPRETLGLVEEAAGTRMYEARKSAALKTISRKQAKVRDNDKKERIKDEREREREKMRGKQD